MYLCGLVICGHCSAGIRSASYLIAIAESRRTRIEWLQQEGEVQELQWGLLLIDAALSYQIDLRLTEPIGNCRPRTPGGGNLRDCSLLHCTLFAFVVCNYPSVVNPDSTLQIPPGLQTIYKSTRESPLLVSSWKRTRKNPLSSRRKIKKKKTLPLEENMTARCILSTGNIMTAGAEVIRKPTLEKSNTELVNSLRENFKAASSVPISAGSSSNGSNNSDLHEKKLSAQEWIEVGPGGVTYIPAAVSSPEVLLEERGEYDITGMQRRATTWRCRLT